MAEIWNSKKEIGLERDRERERERGILRGVCQRLHMPLQFTTRPSQTFLLYLEIWIWKEIVKRESLRKRETSSKR